ncbi:MAG: Gfo/Idh/MocA family oxidoreductase [Candidatus Omnitrophota bacterium]
MKGRIMIYRVGMIGWEDHIGYTLEAIAGMKNVRLAAIARVGERSADRVKSFTAFTAETKVYDDYREMLEKEALDIAAVYTPHGTRAQAIIDAARAGCHIYSEKPLAANLEDLERIKKAVAEANTTLTMMLVMRFYGVYRKVREIVHSGAIGAVAQCSAQKSYKVGDRPEWMKKRGSFAGTIPYIACHSLDLIRWCSGLEFVKGAAFHHNVGKPELKEMENTASMILLANNGATISTRLDYCRPENADAWGDDRLRIAGVDGIVELIGDQVFLMTKNEKKHIVPAPPNGAQFPNLIAAIEGREELVVPAEDCYRITEVVLKLRDAADRQVMTDL